ncbi:MAG TPA: hypothetical protein VHZ96_15760 [Frankiaceae bacterium]|nr:hypothetical protein [Frankiaceae bacterium]
MGAEADRFGWSVAAITVGAVAVLAVAGPAVGARPAVPLTWLLFVGSSVHVASTVALFSFDDVRRHARARPARYVAAPGALLASTVASWLVLPAHGRALLLFAFFGWQLWHYQKQNLGLASLATSAARMPSLRPVERRCITAAGICGVLALVADPAVLQIVDWRPPALLATPALVLSRVGLGLSVAAATALTARRWATASTTASAAAVYLVSVAFPIPLVLSHAPYAAIGGMTLAHGLQYLLLVAHVVAGPPSRRNAYPLLARHIAVLTLVVAAAGVLSLLSHLHGATHTPGRVLFGGYLAMVMTHFVVDAGLWRLREDFPRRWLTQRIPRLLGVTTG